MLANPQYAAGVEMVPVIRSLHSFSQLGRWKDTVLVNTGDAPALTKALAEFDGAVLLMNDAPGRLLTSTQVIVRSCVDAGLRFIVYASSAVVLSREQDFACTGPAPRQGHWMEYAAAKASCEHWIASFVPRSPTRLVVVRPGLIWGPGSPWVHRICAAIRNGHRFLVNGGKGVCNLIHAANFTSAVARIATHTDGPSGFYNLSDAETITWSEYARALAQVIGFSESDVRVVAQRWVPPWFNFRRVLLGSRVARCVLRHLSQDRKEGIRSLIERFGHPPDLLVIGRGATGADDLERDLYELQRFKTKPSVAAMERDYKFAYRKSFETAVRELRPWCEFAGLTQIPQELR
jgi:hypothetical protein